MKRLFSVLVLFVLVVATTAPAFASGPDLSAGRGKGGKAPFALSGVITGIDLPAGTVKVTVACGNKLVKTHIGQSLSLQTTVMTRFLLRNAGSKATKITFNDLAVGQSVSLQGQLLNNLWSVTRLTVGAELTCLP
jgi:hypothetical protein